MGRGRDDDPEDGDHEEEKERMLMVEESFRGMPVPPWTKQITLRAMVTSTILSVVFTFIVCKLNLTTGVVPSLNVAAGLLGFAMVKSWTSLLARVGMLKQPFTRQENTVIQTCVVASSGIAFSSGTASYIMGMTPNIANQSEGGNTPENVKSISLGWMMGFLFLVSFVGLFSIVLLRKRMVLKYKLTYPSGTATATLINSFHTPSGAKQAQKQVWKLFQYLSGSFLWAFFQWFFSAADGCGFASFPTFGLKAFARRFYFDFSPTYVGVGMICPYIVNISLLIGAVISWGIMWPAIEAKKGQWYSVSLSPGSLHGIQGYRIFIAIATMLGDGLFHFVWMICKTFKSMKKKRIDETQNGRPPSPSAATDTQSDQHYDENIRKKFFLRDQIPAWLAILGYVLLATASIIVVPFIFPQLKWYHLIVTYAIAPILAFCNAYGCGLTDWSLASNYGKLAIILFSAWVGLPEGGIIAGLAACGVMMSIVSTASDLMQDFKTGYLTLASPRSMFVSQVFGTALGCVISPLVFWFFYKAYPLGSPNSTYPAPYATIYRGIALIGVEGVSSLPKHCLSLSVGFFAGAIVINLVREVLRVYETKYEIGFRVSELIPIPMALAIPFYLGGYFVVDMCVGSLVLFVWRMRDRRSADELHTAVASGMICGDSLWGIPAAVLALAGVNAPICMKFLSASANARVDKFLG